MHKIAALHIFFSASFCKLLQLGDSNAHIDLLKNQVELGRVRLLTLRKAWPQLAKHEQYKQQQPSASPPPVTQQLVSQIMQTSSFYHPCSSHPLQVFKPGCGINQCEDGKGVPAAVSDMTNTCKSCACTHCGIRTALCGTREGSVSLCHSRSLVYCQTAQTLRALFHHRAYNSPCSIRHTCWNTSIPEGVCVCIIHTSADRFVCAAMPHVFCFASWTPHGEHQLQTWLAALLPQFCSLCVLLPPPPHLKTSTQVVATGDLDLALLPQ